MVSNPSQVIVVPDETRIASHSWYVCAPQRLSRGSCRGRLARAAAMRLAELLALSLDNAPSDWRRQSLEQAIEDVRAFAERDR